MATAVVSGRVDEAVKRRVDRTIRDLGLTVNDVISSAWGYIDVHGDVPWLLEVETVDMKAYRKRRALRGLESLYDTVPTGTPLANLTDEDLRRELGDRD